MHLEEDFGPWVGGAEVIWAMGPGMNDFASERLLWSSVCTPHGTERADAVGGDWLIARLLVAARIRIRLRAKVRLERFD